MATTRTVRRETVIPAWVGTAVDVERLAHSVLDDAFKDQIAGESFISRRAVERDRGTFDRYSVRWARVEDRTCRGDCRRCGVGGGSSGSGDQN